MSSAEPRPDLNPAGTGADTFTVTVSTPARDVAPPTAHDEALVAVYQLLETVQADPARPDLDRWVAHARRQGWHHVEFMAHLCRLAVVDLDGGDRQGPLDAMTAAARAAQDDALLATVLAHRSLSPGHDGAGTDERDRYLARAVALLHDGGGTPLTRVMGYNSCAQGYHRLTLWELVAEMHRYAERELARPIPPGLLRIAGLHRSVLIFNRIDAQCVLACELYETGQRDRARELLVTTPDPPGADSGLPPIWIAESTAQVALIAAVLGDPAPGPSPDLAAAVADSPQTTFTGCVLVADAIRALDRVTPDADPQARHEALRAARDLARQAVALVAGGPMPALESLALSVATRTGPEDTTARQYEAVLLTARREARERELDGALARLRTEQLILENERLTSQAYVDNLTGLGNRFTLDRQRERLRVDRDCPTVTVLLLDLNRFKPVNDTFGHAVGDEVLRRVAGMLRGACRPTDLAVRLGGDEFVLLLHGCEPADGTARAERISAQVAGADWSDLTPGMAVGVSIGAASGPPTAIDSLIERADQDMYARRSADRHRP